MAKEIDPALQILLGLAAGGLSGFKEGKKEKRQMAREDKRDQMAQDQFDLYKANAELQHQLTQNNLELAQYNFATTKAMGTPEEQAAAAKHIQELNAQMLEDKAWMSQFDRANAPEDRARTAEEYDMRRRYMQAQINAMNRPPQGARGEDPSLTQSRDLLNKERGLQAFIDANTRFDENGNQVWNSTGAAQEYQRRRMEMYQDVYGGEQGNTDLHGPAQTGTDAGAGGAAVPEGMGLGGLPMGGADQGGGLNADVLTAGLGGGQEQGAPAADAGAGLVFKPGPGGGRREDDPRMERLKALEIQREGIDTLLRRYPDEELTEAQKKEKLHYIDQANKVDIEIANLGEEMGGFRLEEMAATPPETAPESGQSPTLERLKRFPEIASQRGMMDVLRDPFALKEGYAALYGQGEYGIPPEYMKKIEEWDIPSSPSSPTGTGEQESIGKYYPVGERLQDFYALAQARGKGGAPDWEGTYQELFGAGPESPAGMVAWDRASSGAVASDPIGENLMMLGVPGVARGAVSTGAAAIKGLAEGAAGREAAFGLTPELQVAIKNLKGSPEGIGVFAPKAAPTPAAPSGIAARALHGGELGMAPETPPYWQGMTGGRGGMGQRSTYSAPQAAPVEPSGISMRELSSRYKPTIQPEELFGGPSGPLRPVETPSVSSIMGGRRGPLSGGELGVGRAETWTPRSTADLFNPALPPEQLPPELVRILRAITGGR